jgi:Ca2+-binding RTX toxin-like protein
MPRVIPKIAVVSVLVALIAPVGPASAVVRTYPGCGATLAACIASSPAGTTIRLRTNALVPIPDNLTITKGLSLVAAKGFHPGIGRTGAPTELTFELGGSADVSIRNIVFRQVQFKIELTTGTGHDIIVGGNRFRMNSGVNGDRAIAVYYTGGSRGALKIRNNDISASGTGINVSVQGGPVTISGNRITAPVIDDSSVGISLEARGTGTVKGTIANNLIHDVAGCYCGFNSALDVRGGDTVTFNVGILNNTIANVGVDPGSSATGITVAPSFAPAHLNARIYNNVVANSYSRGINLYPSATNQVTGDRNNVYGVPDGNVYGSYDMGTTLNRNPRFKDAAAANYRLRTTSRIANAGVSCVAGYPLPRGDAAGRFRYFGPGIDLGAYERGSTSLGNVRGVSKTGTNSANRMVGTSGRDVLCGLGGNDRLFGRGNGDFLFGGLGRDRVFGGGGNDRIDLQDGVTGNDAADGGPGLDVCRKDANDRRTSC